MPYDEALADKVRRALSGTPGLSEKRMFGGIAFLVNGTMCVGVDRADLIVRCERDQTDQLLKKKGARVFDLSGGRLMRGWLLVGPEATKTAAGLKWWIDLARAWTSGAEAAPEPKRARVAKAKKVSRGG